MTVGSWSEHALSSAFPLYNGQGYFEYYSDACLAKARATALGVEYKGKGATLDFAQVHQYPAAKAGSAALNKSAPFSPFALHASAYKVRGFLVSRSHAPAPPVAH